MSHTVVFRPQAEGEVRAARGWYEEQRPGPGARFADAIEQSVQRIVSNPLAFPLVHGEIRRAVVRQFPYAVYFRVHEDDIVVLAVMHGRRHPTSTRLAVGPVIRPDRDTTNRRGCHP